MREVYSPYLQSLYMSQCTFVLLAYLFYNVRARKGWNFEKVMRILRLDLEIRRELPYLCSRKSGGRAMNDRV